MRGDVDALCRISASTARQNLASEVMRRGIAKASSRSDLEVGEQKLLQHMKMYVVESKMAELDLTDEELQVWEELKAEYTAAHRAAGEGSGG